MNGALHAGHTSRSRGSWWAMISSSRALGISSPRGSTVPASPAPPRLRVRIRVSSSSVRSRRVPSPHVGGLGIAVASQRVWHTRDFRSRTFCSPSSRTAGRRTFHTRPHDSCSASRCRPASGQVACRRNPNLPPSESLLSKNLGHHCPLLYPQWVID